MVLAFDIAQATNFFFLMLVASCLVGGLLVVPRLDEQARQETDRDDAVQETSQIGVNGTAKRG